MSTARNEQGQPFLLCPRCKRTSAGFNQHEHACPDCLIEILEQLGVPIMRYVQAGGPDE